MNKITLSRWRGLEHDAQTMATKLTTDLGLRREARYHETSLLKGYLKEGKNGKASVSKNYEFFLD